ncbi:hypothetical protein AOLI_G00120060 [Acnodon oligacanthus]
MNGIIIILLQSLCWIKGVVRADDVIQSDIIWAQMGQSATIDCRHTKGATYNEMYWYIQHQGESMKLIVITATYIQQPQFGEGVDENKFSAKKTVAENGSLTVTDLDSADSAVYYCACPVTDVMKIFLFNYNQFLKHRLFSMRRQILIVMIVLHSVSGQNYDIHQNPSVLFGYSGEYHELHCNHRVSDFYNIL